MVGLEHILEEAANIWGGHDQPPPGARSLLPEELGANPARHSRRLHLSCVAKLKNSSKEDPAASKSPTLVRRAGLYPPGLSR